MGRKWVDRLCACVSSVAQPAGTIGIMNLPRLSVGRRKNKPSCKLVPFRCKHPTAPPIAMWSAVGNQEAPRSHSPTPRCVAQSYTTSAVSGVQSVSTFEIMMWHNVSHYLSSQHVSSVHKSSTSSLQPTPPELPRSSHLTTLQ